LLAFLGLFSMHGASASAAEDHCGGSSIAGHAHPSSTGEVMASAGLLAAGMDSVAHSRTPTIAAASLGVPLAPMNDHVGDVCVAILLAGFLIILLGRIRSSFWAVPAATCDVQSSAIQARPPPTLLRSMLSIWRH